METGILLVAGNGPNYGVMIPNFFKSSWRSLTKDRQFTLLNLTGLATGLACALLIWLWVSGDGYQLHVIEYRRFAVRL